MKKLAYFLPQEYARAEANLDFEKPWLVNPVLMRAIYRYDPLLVIYYNKAAAKYAVARQVQKPKAGFHFIASWQDEKGRFLPLDNRLLVAIKSWDMRPNIVGAPTSGSKVAQRMELEEEKAQAKAWADFDDDIGHLTRDNRRQLHRAYGLVR